MSAKKARRWPVAPNLKQIRPVIEVEIEIDTGFAHPPVRDYQGVVSRIEKLTPTIKGIWIKLDNDEALDFQAYYVNLQLPDDIGIRAFSLANPLSTGNEIELNIRLVPGRMHRLIHSQLKVGDKLRLTGPYGRFFRHKSAKLPSLFMAGGSGHSARAR